MSGETAGLGEVQPARGWFADRDTREVASQGIDLRSVSRARDDVPYVPPRDPIPQLVTREKTGGRDQHDTQLDCREHDFP